MCCEEDEKSIKSGIISIVYVNNNGKDFKLAP